MKNNTWKKIGTDSQKGGFHLYLILFTLIFILLITYLFMHFRIEYTLKNFMGIDTDISKKGLANQLFLPRNPREKLLFTIPEQKYPFILQSYYPADIRKSGISDNIAFSPDNQHFLFFDNSKGNEKTRVLFDGKRGTTHAFMHHSFIDVFFSEDSKHYAFIAHKQINSEDNNYSQEYLVIGNESHQQYDDKRIYEEIGVASVIFSSDSNSFAYIAKKNGKSFVVLNNQQESSRFDEIKQLKFIPDKDAVAFIGINKTAAGNESFVIFEGQQYGTYAEISNLIITPQGELIYSAQKDSSDNTFVFMNGKEIEVKFEILTVLQPEPYTGLVYLIGKYVDDSIRYVLESDNQEISQLYHYIYLLYYVNPENFAYVAQQKGGSSSIFLNNDLIYKPSPEKYLLENTVTISKDAKTIGYALLGSNKSVPQISVNLNKDTVYTDILRSTIQESLLDYNLDPLLLSPNGKHWALTQTNSKKQQYIILDGKKQIDYDSINIPHFTDDNKYFIYNAILGNQVFVIEQPLD